MASPTINGGGLNGRIEPSDAAPPASRLAKAPNSNGSGNINGYKNSQATTSTPIVENGPAPFEPIAICGMACRLPGGIHCPQQLWDFLLAKRDARAGVPGSRYKSSSHYSAKGQPGTINSEYGYFLDESVKLKSLDTSFFSISKTELERTDPQQRQLLEVARECIDDSGEVDWRGSNTGVYAGNFGEDWCEMFAKDSQQVCSPF